MISSLLRALYVVFIGWWAGLCWLVIGGLCYVTIIGIPAGRWMFRHAKLIFFLKSSAAPLPQVGNGGRSRSPARNYALEVVGESHYQANLEHICGRRTEEGIDKYCMAVLIADNNNPVDKQAVRVDIQSRTVGHLRHDVALAVRARYKLPLTVPAHITGGWDRGRGDQGHYGVTLDLQ